MPDEMKARNMSKLFTLHRHSLWLLLRLLSTLATLRCSYNLLNGYLQGFKAGATNEADANKSIFIKQQNRWHLIDLVALPNSASFVPRFVHLARH
jgi:hypothetical protein